MNVLAVIGYPSSFKYFTTTARYTAKINHILLLGTKFRPASVRVSIRIECQSARVRLKSVRVSVRVVRLSVGDSVRVGDKICISLYCYQELMRPFVILELYLQSIFQSTLDTCACSSIRQVYHW